MIEGESNCIRHESSQPCLLKDRAWLSWELSTQGQDRGGEPNLPDVVSWSHLGSLEPVTGDHGIAKWQV